MKKPVTIHIPLTHCRVLLALSDKHFHFLPEDLTSVEQRAFRALCKKGFIETRAKVSLSLYQLSKAGFVAAQLVRILGEKS